jgi:OOP family OmpA-OmpF porin
MIKHLAVGAALSAAFLTVHAEQRDANYNWYIDPMLFYTISDSDYGTDIEDGAGGRIIFGRKVTQNLAAEIGLVGDQLENNAGEDISRSGATLDLRYQFGDGGLKPFVLLGAGVVSVDSGAAQKETETVLNAGLGFLWQFHRDGAAVRSEIRAKSIEDSSSNEDFLDYDIGVGVHIPLDSDGGVAELAAPAPVPVVKDSDRDGVADNADRCPRTAAATRVDADGCPIAEVITLEGLNFARNSAQLTLAGSELERALQTLRQYPDMRVLIAGHTDSRSSDSYNQKLSQRRAASVKSWLVQRGIAANRMEIAGFGESRPIADNGTAEGRAKNRRVDLHVLR